MPSFEEVKSYIDLAVEASGVTGLAASWYYRVSIVKAIVKVIRGDANPEDRATAREGIREGGTHADIILQDVSRQLEAHGDETAGERVRALRDEAHGGGDASPGQMV